MASEQTTLTRIYNIARVLNGGETVEVWPVRATSVAEALTMAEQHDAGVRDAIYGIAPEDYADAIAEGIDFNEADGLLL